MDDRQKNGQQTVENGAEAGNDKTANRPSIEAKSITTIYYDCLERIYDFLDLESLLNVAGTCKRLQIAAAAYFGDFNGKRRVSLWLKDENFPYHRKRSIHGYGHNVIIVNGLKHCLPFLRCFGAKIPDLRVFYNENKTNGSDYVDRYINQYCAKTLKQIRFFQCGSKFSKDDFSNQFECVEEMLIENIDLGVHLPYFCHLFPKLRYLSMSGVSIDENCADIQLSSLKTLNISLNRCKMFTKKSLTTFLHANPQLQQLDLDTRSYGEKITFNEQLNMIKGNPSITKLELWNEPGAVINQTDLMRFARERPFMVALNLSLYRIEPQDAAIFIRQLKSLKWFQFQMNNQAEYNELLTQLDSEWKHEYTFYGGDFNEHWVKLMR